jgi:NAD(P)H-dependent flavin oxidoreductase YrpB (nitropropane dioxygenase family)
MRTGRLVRAVWFLDGLAPVVAAPMSGGPTTPALVAAATSAGVFGFLAAGYLTPDAMRDQISQTRRSCEQFGVNVFLPRDAAPDPAELAAYSRELASEVERYGLPALGAGSMSGGVDDWWPEKVELLVQDPVAVVSFTFSIPDAAIVDALQRAGSTVLATVTTADEARRAEAEGVDGLVVQSASAGGHSATTTPDAPSAQTDTAALVSEVRAVSALPVVATGGIVESSQAQAVLAAGAQAAMVGTLLLRTPESAARPAHKAALADPARPGTVVTRAFTGRPARGLRNRFTDEHSAAAPLGYPTIHFLTAPIRAAAAARGDADGLNLWAGTGFRAATDRPAAEVLADLINGL